MTSRLNLLLLVALLCAGHTHAQDGSFASEVLTRLKAKNLVLLNFSADPKVLARWENHIVVLEQPSLHAFAVIEPASVTQHGDTLQIDGQRVFLAVNAETNELNETDSRSPFTILITMSHAQPSVDELVNGLFKPVKDALANVPAEMGSSVIGVFDPAQKKFIECLKCLERMPSYRRPTAINPTTEDITPPKLVKQVAPKMPRNLAFEAEILIGMIVNTSGVPVSMWVVHSAGDTLDGPAAKAVAQYRFKPATKKGVPIDVRVNIEVNFQVK